MVTPKRDPEPLSDEDEQLALSLGVAILAAGNPRQFNTTGDMARAYVRELRRQPLAATHLPAEPPLTGAALERWRSGRRELAAEQVVDAATLMVRSPRFRQAVREVFEAPGEWGPAQGYFAADIDHFIEMLAEHLSDG